MGDFPFLYSRSSWSILASNPQPPVAQSQSPYQDRVPAGLAGTCTSNFCPCQPLQKQPQATFSFSNFQFNLGWTFPENSMMLFASEEDKYGHDLSVLQYQLKKYGDSRTFRKSKSPLSGRGGNTNDGCDVWKLSSNCGWWELKCIKMSKGNK